MFTGVSAIRNTEPKIKVECLQQSITKEMPFNHSKIVYRLWPDSKFDSGPNCLKFEKFWRKTVPHKTSSSFFRTIIVIFSNDLAIMPGILFLGGF